MALKKGDFVRIEYTGKFEDFVFDTTDREVAKKHQIESNTQKYGPMIVCIGEKQVLVGIDEALIGKEPNQTFSTDIAPEKAFGKKDAKYIKLIASKKFQEQNIQLQPGMQVQVDNQTGIVKTVGAGRTLVDFNHPLSGKTVNYQVKILDLVTDTKEKLHSIVGIPDVTIKEKKAIIQTPAPLPEEFQEQFSKKITGLIPELESIEFKKKDISKPVSDQKDQKQAKPE
ncbi:MAG: FKBP-type peptidyl-prolyl cis-trans isomerase [Candidatus Woesearchaeota archaeon]